MPALRSIHLPWMRLIMATRAFVRLTGGMDPLRTVFESGPANKHLVQASCSLKNHSNTPKLVYLAKHH